MAAVAKKWQDELLGIMPFWDRRASLTQKMWLIQGHLMAVNNFLMDHQELWRRRRECRH
jgi:hypothetical protein